MQFCIVLLLSSRTSRWNNFLAGSRRLRPAILITALWTPCGVAEQLVYKGFFFCRGRQHNNKKETERDSVCGWYGQQVWCDAQCKSQGHYLTSRHSALCDPGPGRLDQSGKEVTDMPWDSVKHKSSTRVWLNSLTPTLRGLYLSLNCVRSITKHHYLNLFVHRGRGAGIGVQRWMLHLSPSIWGGLKCHLPIKKTSVL